MDPFQAMFIAGAALIPAAVAAYLAYRFRVRDIFNMNIEMTPLRWAMLVGSAAIIVLSLGYQWAVD